MKEKKFRVFKTGENDKNKRIDKIIRSILPEANLGLIYSSLRKGKININSKKVKQNYKVKENDEVWIHNSLYDEVKLNKIEDNNSNVAINIIYEDEDLLLVNKKAGMLCHGDNSLNNAVLEYLKDKLSYSLSFKPGPINRLDRNTSGLNFFSKSLKGAQEFSSYLQNKKTTKFYLGIVDGKVQNTININDKISRDKYNKISKVDTKGKTAETKIQPLLNKNNFSLCLFIIETGRTHQIRIHSSEAGFPLSGDSKYKGSKILKNYFLHSYAIKIQEDEKSLKKLRAKLTNEQINQLNKILSKSELNSALNKAEEIIKDY